MTAHQALGTRSVFATHITNTRTTFSGQKKKLQLRYKAQDPRNILKYCMDVSCNMITPHPQEEKNPYKRVPLTHDLPLPKHWEKYIIDKHPKYFINAEKLQLRYSILVSILVAVITTFLVAFSAYSRFHIVTMLSLKLKLHTNIITAGLLQTKTQ